MTVLEGVWWLIIMGFVSLLTDVFVYIEGFFDSEFLGHM